MKIRHVVAAAATIILALFGGYYFLGNPSDGERSGLFNKAAWQRMALPGELSKAHAFLEHNCAACHTPGKGVEASNCIVCHADNKSLLQRQPTVFHANVGSCVECHAEHRGIDFRPTQMDHAALTKIGLRQLKHNHPQDSGNERERNDLVAWIGQHQTRGHGSEANSSIAPQEAVLNCAACHSSKDRHVKLFGQDCAQCHTTLKWTIPEFRHPSSNSTDCVQCHQAPPSHYMMHFEMISAKVANKPRAKVSQCYECHQTTAWNDIKDVGIYKHH